MKNIAVIYHDADFDGIASGEVCKHFLKKDGHTVHMYGWDYGRPLPTPEGIWDYSGIELPGDRPIVSYKWEDYDAIYIVDLSIDELMGRPALYDKIVWIDHHKSAIEKWDNRVGPISCTPVPQFGGLRIDGVAACRLCWQWFNQDPEMGVPSSKESYYNREVSEPHLLTLLGEYDVWDKRDDDADLLQYGLRSIKLKPEEWPVMFDTSPGSNAILYDAIRAGAFARNYARTVDANNARAAYMRTLFGMPMVVLNGRGNSKTFDSALERFPDARALCMWFYDGSKVKVSLYHHPDYTDLDLSLNAKEMGGGGHRGACGFTVPIKSQWFLENLA